MRIGLAILLFSLCNILSAQSNDTSGRIVDCESLSFHTAEKTLELFKDNRFDSFDSIIQDLIKHCGISEVTQRGIILKRIKNNQSSLNAIQTYIENDFQYVLLDRIEYSKEIDYGYIYSESKAYFGYVPLRHSIDTILRLESLSLLETNALSPDERLICILFSGDVELFEKELKKKQYDESFVKEYLFEKYRYNSNRWLAYTIYSGVFRPISSNDIFSYSPMIGVSISNSFNSKFIVELGVKVRFNVNDESFEYYAIGDTNIVNSAISIFMGASIGYKAYVSEKLVLIPKFGIGLESVNTGLSEQKRNSDDKTYHDIETLHLSLGLSAMTPVFRKDYIGIGVNFHYCPYQLDKNLLTNFDNNLVSAELFWRF